MGDIDDPIINLRSKSFSSMSLEDKLVIKNSQKRPNLNISQKDGKIVRHFNNKWYETFPWLTGSETENKVYCFPCFLFGGDGDDSSWTKNGVDGVKNFVQKANKHATAKRHIFSNECFHMLGKTRIDHALVESRKTDALRHNEKVSKNRQMVGRSIDVVSFLAKQEMAFRGHVESGDSANKGNYLELLDLLTVEEPAIRDHLEGSTVFRGTSSDLHNDLIESVQNIVQEVVLEELGNAEFVSVQPYETTDVSCRSQLSIILRYIDKNDILEGFLGFYDVSGDKAARGLNEKFLEALNFYKVTNKVVCQTSDGASVMSGSGGGVQTLIKETCPQAIFIHCYAHQLNLALLHGSKSIKEVKLFICNLTPFKTFFSRSPLRSEELRKKEFALPGGSDTRWNFHSRCVFSIKKNYVQLGEVTEFNISPDKFDPESTNLAIGPTHILNNPKFILLLCLFNKIFVYTDHLYAILQTKIFSNVALCFGEVEKPTKNLQSLRSDEVIETIINESENMLDVSVQQNIKNTFRHTAFEILDTIIVQMQERFKDTPILCFVDLFKKGQFTGYSKRFPKKLLQDLKQAYPSMFDLTKLENELIVIYFCDEKNKLGPLELFQHIYDNELTGVFLESFRLFKLFLTMPVTTASSERSMSTLKRIKTHLRNSMLNERLSHLSMLSIETDSVGNYLKYPGFKERVIDYFATNKARRIELIYKSV